MGTKATGNARNQSRSVRNLLAAKAAASAITNATFANSEGCRSQPSGNWIQRWAPLRSSPTTNTASSKATAKPHTHKAWRRNQRGRTAIASNRNGKATKVFCACEAHDTPTRWCNSSASAMECTVKCPNSASKSAKKATCQSSSNQRTSFKDTARCKTSRALALTVQPP